MDPPLDDEAFEGLQNDYMRMQYDELFSRLEARDGQTSLLLIRANWLREMTGGDFALPEMGAELPPEALVSATELRAIFGRPTASHGGYRQVALPFLTVTHFWTHTHPDPDEEMLKAVLDVLQQKWEDFAERDLGLFIELSPPNFAAEDPLSTINAALWLVTCKMRTVEATPEAAAAAAACAPGDANAALAPSHSPAVTDVADKRDSSSPPPESVGRPGSARSSASCGPGSSQASSQAGSEEAL
uniref:Uncharacterized protein n=1 Tax=Haptolina brevifila TaxID=156173 RepID=A0A7S2BZU8_9EUKA